MATATPEPPSLSALSKYIASHPRPSGSTESDFSLALQVKHNLQYQHEWSELIVHIDSPLTKRPLPRPLISGFPPRRIYVHPDDQVDELKQGVKEEDVEVQREWVLPTQLRERWSLKRFAEILDGIGEAPPACDEEEDGEEEGRTDEKETGARRGGKRLLLATLGEDSTVVYYIMHNGIVKPRQN